MYTLNYIKNTHNKPIIDLFGSIHLVCHICNIITFLEFKGSMANFSFFKCKTIQESNEP